MPRPRSFSPASVERYLSFQDIDELVFFCVPVPLRGPTSWSKCHEIHAELRQLKRVAKGALLAAGQLVAERSRIDAAQSRRHAYGIEPGPAPLFRLVHQGLLIDLKQARHGRALPARYA